MGNLFCLIKEPTEEFVEESIGKSIEELIEESIKDSISKSKKLARFSKKIEKIRSKVIQCWQKSNTRYEMKYPSDIKRKVYFEKIKFVRVKYKTSKLQSKQNSSSSEEEVEEEEDFISTLFEKVRYKGPKLQPEQVLSLYMNYFVFNEEQEKETINEIFYYYNIDIPKENQKSHISIEDANSIIDKVKDKNRESINKCYDEFIKNERNR